MRSKLFVPGSRPELFDKALITDADAVSIDLEDSVDESRKAEARDLVADFLESPKVLSGKKIIIVRCNALDSRHFTADVLAVARQGLTMLNLPKVESADAVRNAAAVLERSEAKNGVLEPIRLLVTIESPGGLRAAAEIAGAHPRVAGLQLGLSDLFLPLGIQREDGASLHSVMFALRMAAGEARVFAYDGAFPNIDDKQGFIREAQLAQRLGYWGKSCIHPSQVALANKVFAPGEDELAFSERVVAASRAARAKGAGVFVVDGKMIDLPGIRRAEALLASKGPAR